MVEDLKEPEARGEMEEAGSVESLRADEEAPVADEAGPRQEGDGPEEQSEGEDAGEAAPEAAEDIRQLKALVEALIFASSGIITFNAICKVIAHEDRTVVRRALKGLIDDYRAKEGGFYIEEVAGGYEFRTRPEFAQWVKALLQARPRRLSRPALETLAMVAYRQPVTRGEIEAIRGVDSGGVLSTLMERRLVRISGRKNAPGRPAVYSTTREFLEVFDLKDLSSLPSLKEIETPEDEYEDNDEEMLEPIEVEEDSKILAPDTEEAVEEIEEDGPEEEKDRGDGSAPEGAEGNQHGGDSIETQGRGADSRGPGDDKRGDSTDRGQS